MTRFFSVSLGIKALIREKIANDTVNELDIVQWSEHPQNKP